LAAACLDARSGDRFRIEGGGRAGVGLPRAPKPRGKGGGPGGDGIGARAGRGAFKKCRCA